MTIDKKAPIGDPLANFAAEPMDYSTHLSTDLPDVAPIDQPIEQPFAVPAFPVPSIPANLPPRAAYEVDHFAWPELCDTLAGQISDQLDPLAEQLLSESALGRKVIGLIGSRTGEGRTTLALVLARRLADSGAKVLLVDADFESPEMAARLGLGIQSGWPQALAGGHSPWEAMIESLDDRLAILPLAPRTAFGAAATVDANDAPADVLRPHLDTLRQHFDVVLVDAGATKASHSAANETDPLSLAAGFDGAILVADARAASVSRLTDIHRRLLDANIVPLGVAETFCKLDA